MQQVESAVAVSIDPLKVRASAIPPCWMVILGFVLIMYLPLGMDFIYPSLLIFLLFVALISGSLLQENLRLQKVKV